MAENTPNKPDDKKDVPANETQKKENAVPVNEPVKADGKAPDNKEPEKAATQEAGKSEQDKKETPENKKVLRFDPNKKAAEKGGTAKDDKKSEPGLSPADEEKLRREQEALLLAMDAKAADLDKKNKAVKNSIPAAPPKEEKKEPTAAEMKERKAKIEKELREKYGIPKTGKPVEPWVAPEKEEVVRIPHDKLHGFKGHTFNVDKNAKYWALVSSIRARGVTQPAVVRPDGKDGYEIVSGHRRDTASIDAELPFTPCIIRALNDEQAIQQMVEDNAVVRDISLMELARSLNAQLESIKKQGARETLAGKDLSAESDENIGKRSNQIIAERNGMSIKQVQRHIALNNLTPDLQALVEGKVGADGKPLKIKFTPAFELSYIKPENQNYIAFSVEENQSTPSLSQVQRMRELDGKGKLNPDMIDGILQEEKKEGAPVRCV